MMARCFVIQPFDNGVFDSRYEDTFSPAIVAAGLEPYRVDRDPSTSVPIQDIETGIRESTICLADISLDNPNVWFELGFAFASYKQVVMVCSDERKTKFPFDVQHRAIVKYSAGSKRDFETLEKTITEKLTAYLKKEDTLIAIGNGPKLKLIEGLEQHEVMVLATIGEIISGEGDGATPYLINISMGSVGYTRLACTLGIRGLREKKLIEPITMYDEQTGDPYDGYTYTEAGWEWLSDNRDQFLLKRSDK